MVYSKIPALIVSLLALPLSLSAQTADDYFHGGVTNYIFGEKERATKEIVTGLQHFPADPKLNQVALLLKKKEEEQQQQQQQQKQNDQKQDEKKDQKQDSKDSQKNESQQKKDSDQNQQSQQEKEKEKQKQQAKDKKNQEEQAKKAAQEQKDKKGDEEPAQAYAPGQMTPQQAKQLLDAQKGDEMIIPIKPEGKPKDPGRPIKDW